MFLTDAHIEAIKDAALNIDFGKIIIHIDANSHYLDITLEKRIRLPLEIEKLALTALRPPLLATTTRQSPGKPHIATGG
jgi:hypothetical protein